MTSENENGPVELLLKRALTEIRSLRSKVEALSKQASDPISVIGMGCRLPGNVSSPDAFWTFLNSGADGVSEVSGERWSWDPSIPGSRWAGLLQAVDLFDAKFFGISPREAAYLDPQHRLLLEVCWEALEDAGLPVSSLPKARVGTFVGITSNDYRDRMLASVNELDGYAFTGNGHSLAAGRISHALGFEGPCLAVDTACSSSLVAVHLAVESLRRNECDVAVVAGVNLLLAPPRRYGTGQAMALSPDGRCKSFDAGANGMVRAEGCGAIVLKRTSDVRRDGDRPWCTIRGSAINHDGRASGFTAPNVLSQAAVIRTALRASALQPEQVDYVEAHGTGTALGDPIEFEALRDVYGQGPIAEPCVLGSAKAHLGHAEAAAGVVGLIKAALSLEHERIPALLHFETLNPRMGSDGSRLQVPTEARDWSRGARGRFAAVSSFGISGTNAHVVLEEAAEPRAKGGPRSAHPAAPGVLLISAKSEQSLRALAERYAEMLQREPAPRLDDVCLSAATRRVKLDLRAAFVAMDRASLARQLQTFAAGTEDAGVRATALAGGDKQVWIFSGFGSQWAQMGRAILEAGPAALRTLSSCDAEIRKHCSWSLLALLRQDEVLPLADGEIMQPVIFALQVAIAAQYEAWGLTPAAVVGHSMGEVAAAHVAGALSLADAVRIMCRRVRLLARLRGRGAMAVVGVPHSVARELIADRPELSVAVVNGSQSTVLSGAKEPLTALFSELEKRGVFVRWVQGADGAGHSVQVDALRSELLSELSTIDPRPTRVPFYSSVTTNVQAGETLDGAYWFENARQPVLFHDTILHLARDGHGTFLEISPHPLLTTPVRDSLAQATGSAVVLASMRREQEQPNGMLAGLAAAVAHGAKLDWKLLLPDALAVDLPTYPWQQARFWLETTPASRPAEALTLSAPVSVPSPEAVAGTGALRGQLDLLAPEQAEAALATYIRTQAALVLGASAAEIPLDRPLADLGLDSMMSLELGERLSRALAQTIELSVVLDHPTPAALARHLSRTTEKPVDRPSRANAWFSVPAPRAAPSLKLICFPYLGGLAAAYSGWPAKLSSQLEIRTVQLPGRPPRSQHASAVDLDGLVCELCAAIEGTVDGPYAFYGHSFGGLLAFEVMRALRARGAVLPRHLVVGAFPAPHLTLPKVAIDGLTDTELVPWLARLGGIPPALLQDPVSLSAFVPSMRSDLTLLTKWQFREEPAFDVPITAIGGKQDTLVSAEQLSAWGRHTTVAFEAHIVEGDHFFIRAANSDLMALLTATLRAVPNGASTSTVLHAPLGE